VSARSAVPSELLGIRYREGRTPNGGPPHVESWFLKANAPDARRALWVRCTIFARPPLPPVAEAWAIAFDRQRGHIAIKSTVQFASGRFAKEAFDVEVDGCGLSDTRARGALSSGRGSLTWDLAIGAPLAAPIVHLPLRAMYLDGVPPFTKLVTPLSDARAAGAVRIERGADVETWDVEAWPMMIGHNWGSGNAELYAWTHCNAFDVEGLVFEGISARARVGPLLSPMTSAAYVRWRGKSWDLSRLRALPNNRGAISFRRWEMTGHDRGVHVTCDVGAETDDIVGLYYPNPSGSITHCLNTKLARARLEVRLPDGETIVATSRAAALEIGTTATDHGVRMYL
jgi:hypothetical protein